MEVYQSTTAPMDNVKVSLTHCVSGGTAFGGIPRPTRRLAPGQGLADCDPGRLYDRCRKHSYLSPALRVENNVRLIRKLLETGPCWFLCFDADLD